MDLTKVLAYSSLVLLFSATLFKMLHFPGSGVLLLVSFAVMASCLVTGTLQGARHYREKGGKLLLFVTVTGIALLLLSYGFQILQLPGSFPVKFLAVLILIAVFPGMTIRLARQGNAGEHIMILLHQRHSGGIERYLMLLLLPALALAIIMIAAGSSPAVARTLLVLLLGAAGLHFFALQWNQPAAPRWLQVVFILGFVCFILPWLSVPGLPQQLFTFMVAAFYLLAAVITFHGSQGIPRKTLLLVLLLLISAMLLMWVALKTGWLHTSSQALLFNAPVLGLLLWGLFFFYKHTLPRTYLMLVVAYYMLEFPYQLGWW